MQNNADHLVELESLVRQIDKDMPEERIDAKSVARFQMGLLQFMENALGPNVRCLHLLTCIYRHDHSILISLDKPLGLLLGFRNSIWSSARIACFEQNASLAHPRGSPGTCMLPNPSLSQKLSQKRREHRLN
jgi:hypothetical protein